MIERDDLDLAALWRDQVDTSDEEAAIRALAKDIELSASRRRKTDLNLGLLALLVILVTMAARPVYWWVLLLGGAIVLAAVLVRHHLHKGAQELLLCDPEKYGEAALSHAQAELSFSNFCLFSAYPMILILMLLLRVADTGNLEAAVQELFAARFPKLLLATAASVGLIALFLKDNRRLRDHIRQLEALNRERRSEEERDQIDPT